MAMGRMKDSVYDKLGLFRLFHTRPILRFPLYECEGSRPEVFIILALCHQ